MKKTFFLALLVPISLLGASGNLGAGGTGLVQAMALQQDGKIVVAQERVVTYTYTKIDFPGAFITFAFGLNEEGNQVVGNYFDSTFARHAFLLSDGAFSTIDPPGSAFDNSANNINNSGQIVGQYLDSGGAYHGFQLADGVFTTIDFPSAVDSFANGINNRGQIVGDYLDSAGADHGFLLSHGVFTTIDFPGATDSAAENINDAGQIVGEYLDSAGVNHGYLLSRGAFTKIDFPGAVHTFAIGNNDKGDIVGRYVTDNNPNRSAAQHAFLLTSSGNFITGLDGPCSGGRHQQPWADRGTLPRLRGTPRLRRDTVGESMTMTWLMNPRPTRLERTTQEASR